MDYSTRIDFSTLLNMARLFRIPKSAHIEYGTWHKVGMGPVVKGPANTSMRHDDPEVYVSFYTILNTAECTGFGIFYTAPLEEPDFVICSNSSVVIFNQDWIKSIQHTALPDNHPNKSLDTSYIRLNITDEQILDIVRESQPLTRDFALEMLLCTMPDEITQKIIEDSGWIDCKIEDIVNSGLTAHEYCEQYGYYYPPYELDW